MKEHKAIEKSLLKKAQRFDQKALAQIYDEYSLGLYRYASRLIGNPSVAEDCVADTFSRFLQALKTGHGPKEHLKAYLYRIAHNWIVDYYRKEPETFELEGLSLASENSIEHDVNLKIRQAQVREAIQLLTSDQQQVIALKYLDGWQNQEVAEFLKKPVGAVKSMQHRALASLQRILTSKESF